MKKGFSILNKKILKICLLVSVLIYYLCLYRIVLADTSDDYIGFNIILDDNDVNNATVKESAIEIDPDIGVNVTGFCYSLSNYSIYLDVLNFNILVADTDVFSYSHSLDVTLKPDENISYIQTWDFKKVNNISLISGIYKIRYDYVYSVEGINYVLVGKPFYIKITGNPFTSVAGVLSSMTVALSVISLGRYANSIRTGVPREITRAIPSTKISPTEKLRLFYKGYSATSIQKEISNSSYNFIMNVWKCEDCPSCGAKWVDGIDICPTCNVTLVDAKKLYSNALNVNALRVSKDLVDSVSVLNVSSIALSLGMGIMPTMDIISVLSGAGLTLAQPRVAKDWSAKTRKLVFQGLSTSLFSIFWIQACGIDVVSISMLAVAIVSGFVLPILFSKLFSNRITSQIKKKLSPVQI